MRTYQKQQRELDDHADTLQALPPTPVRVLVDEPAQERDEGGPKDRRERVHRHLVRHGALGNMSLTLPPAATKRKAEPQRPVMKRNMRNTAARERLVSSRYSSGREKTHRYQAPMRSRSCRRSRRDG